MEAYWGSGGIAPCILDLGSRWRWVVSFTPRPLYPQGKRPWYPLDRRMGGPQNWSGRGGEEKNSSPLPGLEPPIIQPIAQRCTAPVIRLFQITHGNKWFSRLVEQNLETFPRKHADGPKEGVLRWREGEAILRQHLCQKIFFSFRVLQAERMQDYFRVSTVFSRASRTRNICVLWPLQFLSHIKNSMLTQSFMTY
jgi:hypothetical protein